MRQVVKSVLTVLSTVSLLVVTSVPARAQSGSRNLPPSSASNRKEAPVALEGYCPVSLKTMNKWVKGVPLIQTVFDGHTYHFANEQGKKMFLANRQAYANADLAYGGQCVVCRVEMKQAVAGKPEFTVIHDGLRYLFPSDAQRKMFLENPQKYVVRAAEQTPTAAGSGSR